ncbi:peptidoglycan DD-metalloendopeptidase family protein [Vibrio sp. Of7-15]|uniref:peptidoglycan DD-metalloendopeptidase family protein n=1 Tax=Vibrio sp. Of7-15 TaxID=2724879 RepID=UPI001EF2728C|nr:peptidoglycan DD-metalloendopeptidase family protein [Vibrio sp. Of7-15]MCG7497707.1 peptidoglycan DD-metalloendopeptidase family protein [Vibrio sp. Of7-15]
MSSRDDEQGFCPLPEQTNNPIFRNAYFPRHEISDQQCHIDEPHYDPIKEKPAPVADFEYSIEIACELSDLNTYQVGVFSLGKTKSEANISSWSKTQTDEGHTLLTANVYVNEPKTLYREFFLSSSGGMTFNDVQPVKKGTVAAIDSFVPIKPSIQVYERLSWPKIGFFYHFIDDVLVNEYQLSGGNKWSFKVTHSKNKALTSERLSEHEYSFILLPWKINDILISRQHLLYTVEKITQEQLSEIDAQWLDENARLFNPDDVVAASREEQLERTKPNTYVVKPGDFFSTIAKRHNLTSGELKALNPQIKDTAFIYPGDTIYLKKQAAEALTSETPKPAPTESSENIETPPPVTEPLPVDLNQDKKVFPHHNIVGKGDKNLPELAHMPILEAKNIKGSTPIINVGSICLQSKLFLPSTKLNEMATGKKAQVIKKGAKSDEVKLIQEALLKMKFNIGRADGDFGKGTHEAVIKFQTNFAPTNTIHPDYKTGSADGIVGKNTLLALDEALITGWERVIPPFQWHEPLLNPMSTNYWQSGGTGENKAYAWGLFGKKIRGKRRHDGLDLFAEVGTDVYACVDSKIVYNSYVKGYGNVLILAVNESEVMWENRREYKPRTNLTKVELKQYDDFEKEYNKSKQLYLMYAHLDSIDSNIKVGSKVKSGDIIGKTGVSGISDGTHAPHLHFEVRTKKVIKRNDMGRCNPSLFVKFKDYSQQSEDERKQQKDARDKEAKARKK